jgi:hypothetical protein
LPVAAVIVVWGARTDRPWTVAVAATLGLPLIWPHGLCVALAAVPFLRLGDRIVQPGRTDWPAAASLRDFVAIVGAVVGGALAIALVFAGPLEALLNDASRNIAPYLRRP